MKSLAFKRGVRVLKVLTESKSAKSPGRPVFGELLSLMNRGEIDEVLCWKLDRLARNPVDGGALIWAFEEGKLKSIHTPGRSFSNTGDDKFWMQLEFGMAKKYVDDLSQNVKRGLREKLERGWLPGMAPLGYRNDPASRTIVRDRERFGLIRRMWDLMLTGRYNPSQIRRIAAEEWGLRTRVNKRGGGGTLTLSGTYRLFTQPFYYGGIFQNGVLYPGNHEAMISKSEFDKVQILLGLRSRPRPQEHGFAFTGLIRCGECGCSITAENRIQRHGHKYVYYRCTKKKLGVKCSQPHIQVKDLESQIIEFLDSIRISPGIADWANRLLARLHKEEMAHETDKTESVRRRFEACNRELAELVNLRIRGLLTDIEFAAKKNELEEERFKLKELLSDGDGRFEEIQKRFLEVFEFAATARETFEHGGLEERRAVLRFTGSNLTLTDKKLRIEPQKPLFLIQNALKGRGLKNLTLEPATEGEVERRILTHDTVIANLSALVHDVRTCVADEIMQMTP